MIHVYIVNPLIELRCASLFSILLFYPVYITPDNFTHQGESCGVISVVRLVIDRLCNNRKLLITDYSCHKLPDADTNFIMTS